MYDVIVTLTNQHFKVFCREASKSGDIFGGISWSLAVMSANFSRLQQQKQAHHFVEQHEYLTTFDKRDDVTS